MPNSPSDHYDSVSVTPDIDETPNSPTLIASAFVPLDIDPNLVHFSDPCELGLSIPYPPMIIERTSSLYYQNIQVESISRVAAWQNN